MAHPTAPQCTGVTLHMSRPFERRCTRPAAKKHGYKFCGRHAPKPRYCGATVGDRFRHHREDCAGCNFDCCRDRSLCVPGRCFVVVDAETAVAL